MAKDGFQTERAQVQTVTVHCPFEGGVTVTEWHNGEGFSIDMASEKGGVGVGGCLQVTWEQWQGLKKAVKALRQ